MTRGWDVTSQPGGLTLSRGGRSRFDIEASCNLPAGLRRLRLAHNIRQDIWRALRDLRGFSPVIELRETDGATLVRAGGQLDGAARPALGDKLASVLTCSNNRSRWIAQCQRH